MKKIILAFLLLASSSVFAANLASFSGDYNARKVGQRSQSAALQVLTNGNAILHGLMFDSFNGVELGMVPHAKAQGVFYASAYPFIMIYTGENRAAELGCSANELQNMVVVISGAEGPNYFCLSKMQ